MSKDIRYLKFAGENTPTQSSPDGLGDSISNSIHSVSSPCKQIRKMEQLTHSSTIIQDDMICRYG